MEKRNKTEGPGAGELLAVKIFFAAAPFAAGLFYEPLSAAASVCLLAWLVLRTRRAGGLVIPKNAAMTGLAALALFYAAGALWGTDRGMAPMGFVKFLPLPLFLIVCCQLSAEQRGELLALLPWSGAAMTVLSLLLSLIPAAAEYVLVSGRLAGFFQYPNTFAIYVLLGVPVLTARERWGARELACLLILLAGAALSGSRTAAVLMVCMIAAYCFVLRDGRRKLILAAGAAAALAAAFLLRGRTDAVSAVGRALAGGAGASTFYGRLLYYRDALPEILRHPFGMGYLGYYFRQGSFQTGVYSVMHVHNDLLQLLLDAGWLPAGLLAYAVIRSFLELRGDTERRMMLALIVAHCMFDFDLQFIAMDFILLLVMEPMDRGGPRIMPSAALAAGGVLAAVCLYFGASSALHYLGAPAAAAALYPGNTLAWLEQLSETEDPAEMADIAERILALNDDVSLAHCARARSVWSKGDIGRMISEERHAIDLAKYDTSLYLDYLDMLSVSVSLYESAGDGDSADYCRGRMLEVPELMAGVRESTSALGWLISDRPDLRLPESYEAMIAALR